MADWIKSSYMARSGVAKAKPGKTHELTVAKQGKYLHYVYGPYSEPSAHHRPRRHCRGGNTGRVRGRDQEREGQAIRIATYAVPQSAVRSYRRAGSEKKVRHALRPYPQHQAARSPAGHLHDRADAEFGGLVSTNNTAMLNPPLPELVKKMEVTEQGIKFNKKITLPYEPFIGTLGVSPEIEAVSSLQPDYWGGNMDVPDVAPGAIVYFPVLHKDAYLFLGDCHATQGDGELCGVAVEIASTTTIHVDLIKKWPIAWPRLENEKFIMTIGSTRPMEDAARIAYRELIRWLVSDYGFDQYEAYFLLTQAGRIGSATWSIRNTASALQF